MAYNHKSLMIYVDGVLDSRHDMDIECIESYEGCLLGVGDSNGVYEVDSNSSVWISKFFYHPSNVDGSKIFKNTTYLPYHKKLIKSLVNSFINEGKLDFLLSLFETVCTPEYDLYSDLTRFLMAIIYDVEAFLVSQKSQHKLLAVFEKFASDASDECFREMEKPEIKREGALFYAKMLARLSGTTAGRKVLIRETGFLRVISTVSDVTHFWLEIATANIFADTGMLEGVDRDAVYFKRKVYPFSTSYEDSKAWKDAHPALFLILQDPSILVTIIKVLQHTSASEEKPANWNYDTVLDWLVHVIETSLNCHPSEIVLDPHPNGHDYGNNESTSGLIELRDCRSFTCSFDERTSTEKNCDYLRLWHGKEKKEPIAPDFTSDGRFSGTDYKKDWQEFTVRGKKLWWEWTSDYSNTDWGVRMFIRPKKAEIPASYMFIDRFVDAGALKPLVELNRHIDRRYESSMSLIMSALLTSERARHQADNNGVLERLLQKLKWLRFNSKAEIWVCDKDGEKNGLLISKGLDVYVDQVEWIDMTGEVDKEHHQSEGHYRCHVIEPRDAVGYVKMSDLQQVDLDSEFLHQLGLLSMESRNRKAITDAGKMDTILRIAKCDDPVCVHAAVLSIDDVADNDIRWAKSCAAYEILSSFESNEYSWYCSHTLEAIPQAYFKSSFPSYYGTVEGLLGCTVTKGPKWISDDGDSELLVIGKVTSVDKESISVLWNMTSEPKKIEHFDINSDTLRIVRDSSGNIVGYPIDCHSTVIIDADDSLKNLVTEAPSIRVYDASGTKFAIDDDPTQLDVLRSVDTDVIRLEVDIETADANVQLPEGSQYTIHVLPKFDAKSGIQLSIEEDAFIFLKSVILNEESETNPTLQSAKTAAISAMGKMVKLRDNTYRDRVIYEKEGDSLFLALLDFTTSTNYELSKTSSEVLVKMFSDTTQLMQIIQVLSRNKMLELYQVSSYIAYSFCRLTQKSYMPYFVPLIDQKKGGSKAKVNPYEFAEFNTKVVSNNLDFPVTNKPSIVTGRQVFPIVFDNAIRIKLKFHPDTQFIDNVGDGGGYNID
jgi:hypothetical protein